MNTIIAKIKQIMSEKQAVRDLGKFNIILAGLHFVQGITVLALSAAREFPITINYLTTNSLATSDSPTLVAASSRLFDINLAYLVAAFFFMSALAHFLNATVYKNRYEANLKKGINKVRWIEYGFSASTMMVAIAILSGVYDIASLVMIFSLILIMNLLGLVMEVHNQKAKKINWLSFIVGCIAGIVPWIIFAIYVIGATVYGDGNIPTFVYWIYASIFIFFNCFAINMYLQYKKRGKWADYLYGERAYMILSLVAKTALAWQVFAGALRP